MPAVSQAQQKAAGMALASKKKKLSPSKLTGAARQMYDSMSVKELEKFASTERANLPEKKEESMSLLDNDILTEAQKTELKKVIDEMIEERVQARNKEFISKYTKLIAESAMTKVLDKIKLTSLQHIDEELSALKTKTERVCRSVILESADKVRLAKKQQKDLISQFQNTAPQLIQKLAEEKANELAAKSLNALSDRDKFKSIVENITKGLEKSGYVINEDVEHVIEKEQTEKMMLRTKLIRANRDLKLAQLTEGLLPSQKREIEHLLEDCTTDKMVEDRFLLAKKKVLESGKIFEEEVISAADRKNIEQTKKVLSEEEAFTSFLGAVKSIV